MIKKYKKNLTILFFSAFIINAKSMIPGMQMGKNQYNNQMQEPMYNNPFPINEEELEKVMQNIYDEYQKLPQEERLAIAEECRISIEELEKSMNEVGEFLNQNAQTKNNKGVFEKTDNQSNTYDNQYKNDASIKIETKNQTKSIGQEQDKIIKNIENAIKNLQILLSKIEDPYIKDFFTNTEQTKLKSEIQIFLYYINIIVEKSKKNFFSEMQSLDKIATKINQLGDNIKNIIPLQEHINNKIQNSLYVKYSLPNNDQTKLIKKIENILESEKNKLASLQEEITNNTDKKIKSQIAQSENIISKLEQDLIEAQTNNSQQAINNQINETINLTEKAINFIFEKISQIFKTDNTIETVENIIKKYLPEEIKLGKQKEQEIRTKQKKELADYEKKGSQGAQPTNDRKIPFDSNKETTENETNNYKYQGLQNDQQPDLTPQLDKNQDNKKDDGSTGGNKSDRKSKRTSSEEKSYDEPERKQRSRGSTEDTDSTDNERISKQNKQKTKRKKKKKKKKDDKNETNEINIVIKTIEDAIAKTKETLNTIKTNSDEKMIEILKANVNQNIQNIVTQLESLKYEDLALIPLNPTYDPLKENTEAEFIKHQITLYNKANSTKPFDKDTMINYSNQQKIYYDVSLLREEMLQNTASIKKTLTNEIQLINQAIAQMLEKQVNYYVAKKEDLPFWIKEWEQIPSIKTSINKDPYSSVIKNSDTTSVSPSN
jgi:hypothetical protein